MMWYQIHVKPTAHSWAVIPSPQTKATKLINRIKTKATREL
jgi:hypothetical protein